MIARDPTPINSQVRNQSQAIPLFKHYLPFLHVLVNAKKRYKYNARMHAGGGGGGARARLRSFYIIITPRITFFAICPP